ESVAVLVGSFEPAAAAVVDLCHFGHGQFAILVFVALHGPVHQCARAETTASCAALPFARLSTGPIGSLRAFGVGAADNPERGLALRRSFPPAGRPAGC